VKRVKEKRERAKGKGKEKKKEKREKGKGKREKGRVGASQSQLEQLEHLEGHSTFSQQELQKMLVRFRKLDTDGSGALSLEEFFKYPDIKENPLAKRVIDIFDEDGGGDVDFEEFVKVVFSFLFSFLLHLDSASSSSINQSINQSFRRRDCPFSPPRVINEISLGSHLRFMTLTETDSFQMVNSSR